MTAVLSDDEWRELNARFDTAMQLADTERANFLAELRVRDPRLAAELATLLALQADHPEFLERPAVHLPEPSSTPPPRAPGTVVQEFDILEEIGRGGFSRVYRARDRRLGRHVALKETRGARREATTMAGLEHDSIVTVYSVQADGNADCLIAMQLVAGPTLKEVIERLRPGMAITDAIDHACDQPAMIEARDWRERSQLEEADHLSASFLIGVRLAEALAFAHERGILHLDVKPANVLLSRSGRPMLTDFNVSLSQAELSQPDFSMLGGTARYMSPEQRAAIEAPSAAAVQRLSPRTDIYSLALVLRELVSAGLPATAAAPPEMAAVLARALHPDPDQRYQTAHEFAQALEAARGLRRAQANLPPRGLILRWVERHPIGGVLAAVFAPQAAASLFNIVYNAEQIVGALDEAQRRAFNQLILPYNLFFYGLGVIICWRHLAALWRFLRAPGESDGAAAEALRQRILAVPRVLLLASSVGWLPGAVLFPAFIDARAGDVSGVIYLHFAISFVISWLVAATYSLIAIESLTMHLAYPRLWRGEPDIRGRAERETAEVERRARVVQVASGLIPLAGAVTVVGWESPALETGRLFVFRTTVVGLIALGMLGFLVALRAGDRIRAVCAALRR